MHYYSWSFVCVSFHVVTWLLSSMVRIISLMPMFRVLWSQHAMLYFKLIKIVLGACHLKNYYFVITYLLEDEQELNLGMLDTSQAYLYFLRLHGYFTPIALCFVYTSWHFYAFFGTNLLTRCHNASSYFLLFLCFRKVTQETFSELDETKAKVPIYLKGRRNPEERRIQTRRRPHHRVARATPGHATRWCGPLVHPLTSPFRL
jgi:hypothetical protein